MPETEYNNNMCRVCLQEHNDEFESVFTDKISKNELSELGFLYEELCRISIQAADHHPQYLCNYCNLQLQSFHKFKTKAVESYMEFCEYANNKVKVVLSDMELPCDETEETKFEVIECNVELVKCENGTEMSVLEMENDMEQEEFEDVQYMEEHEDDSIKVPTATKPHLTAKSQTESLQTKNLSCKKCDKVFEKKTHLIKHRQSVHKIIKYTCTLCPIKYQSKEALEVHMNTHKGLPAYQCNLCDKTFKQKNQYIYHNQGHQNEKNAVCDLCGKGFRNKFDLRRHLRMHTDERRGECDVCGKKFRTYTHMTKHRYAHFGKTFECEFCRKKFTTPPNLKQHIKTIHSDERPYKCFICSKQFKRSHHLKSHQKTH